MAAPGYRIESVGRAEVENRFLWTVYRWMSLGLFATGIAALGVASSPAAINLILGNRVVFYGLLIAELAIVWMFRPIVQRLSPAGAAALFVGYSVLNGLTLSMIFLVYTAASITSTFFICAGTFGAMSAYGALTKRSLASWGSFLFMGLIGVVIASIVNIFLKSTMLYWLVTYAGVLVFVGLTAYDTQRIKQYGASGGGDTKGAIHGALALYLDFINLFLMLLRLFGKRR